MTRRHAGPVRRTPHRPSSRCPPARGCPAETDPHERTLIAWPTEPRRDAALGRPARAARGAARAGRPRDRPLRAGAAGRRPGRGRRCRDAASSSRDIEVLAEPIDDSWLRDSGPVIARAPDGGRHALCFRLHRVGRLVHAVRPGRHDRRAARRRTSASPRTTSAIAGEGGAVARRRRRHRRHDGTLPAEPEPQPRTGPRRRSTPCCAARSAPSGSSGWPTASPRTKGPTATSTTSSRSSRPGRCLLQGCDDPANPNHAIARANRADARAGRDRRDRGAGAALRRRSPGPGSRCPYVNLYPVNGAVLVPDRRRPRRRRRARADRARAIRGREVIGVPGAVLAYGGGGVHCITQPVPA